MIWLGLLGCWKTNEIAGYRRFQDLPVLMNASNLLLLASSPCLLRHNDFSVIIEEYRDSCPERERQRVCNLGRLKGIV